MNIQTGRFYFIKDDYFKIHDKEHKLMQNKEGEHQRPCYFALQDKSSPDIFWCVPISSQIAKYEAIVQRKLGQLRQRGVSNPYCSTIRFGYVLGYKRAFLIQNMFPVTQRYVSNQYMNDLDQRPVAISPQTEKDIFFNAERILQRLERGNKNLVYADVLSIRNNLLEELHPELAASQQPAKVNMREQLDQAKAEAEKRRFSDDQGQNAPRKEKHLI